MDWPNVIDTLRKRGWTQVLLAARLGVAQSAVSDLGRGVTKEPKYSVGLALADMLESGEAPQASPAPEPAAAVGA